MGTYVMPWLPPQALARYVIVFNCSDGVDFKMTGKMFSGLAQTGESGLCTQVAVLQAMQCTT
jgi:hypothetical protein